MSKNENKDRGILLQIQDVADEICNHYCKYPDAWDEEKKAVSYQREHCQNCPLIRL